MIITVLGWLMTIGGIFRIVLPQIAIGVGSTIYNGRASTIVVALITGTLGAFLTFQRLRPAFLKAGNYWFRYFGRRGLRTRGPSGPAFYNEPAMARPDIRGL